jgi:hypothetical protein
MMAVSVDISIVTGSEPSLAGGLSLERIWHGWTPITIVLQTDLVYIDVVHTLLVTSDCLSYECGLDQCLTCLSTCYEDLQRLRIAYFASIQEISIMLLAITSVQSSLLQNLQPEGNQSAGAGPSQTGH